MATKIDLDVKDFNRRLNEVATEVFDPRFQSRLGRLAKSIIYKRVKAGYGTTVGGRSRKKLKPLSTATVAVRSGKLMIRHQKGTSKKIYMNQDDRPRQTGEFFSPARSNLTFSGELLNSIEIDVGRYGFSIYIPDTTRRRYNKFTKTRATNKEVAIYVQDAGRNFFELTGPEVDIIIKTINDFIKSTIRKKGL